MNEMEIIKILDIVASVLIIIGLVLAVAAAIGTAREWYLFKKQQKIDDNGNHKQS